MLLLLLKQLHCAFERFLQFGFVHLVLRFALVYSPFKVVELFLNRFKQVVHLHAVGSLQFLLFSGQFFSRSVLHVVFKAIQFFFPSQVAFFSHLFGVLAFSFKVLVSALQVGVSLVEHAFSIFAFGFQLLFQFANLPFVSRLCVVKEHKANGNGHDDDKCKNYFHGEFLRSYGVMELSQ